MIRLLRMTPPIAAAALIATALAGCGQTDRIVASSIPLDDYTARHPIVLTESRTAIDVFPTTTSGRLDRHTAKQVYAFAEQYRELGRGQIVVLVPRGQAEHAAVTDIRRLLALGGARNGINVATYPVADPALASPIRISYEGLRARVPDQCGQWPRDLSSGSSIEGWDNKPYWNLGCATQTMIAAQTSDPRDLVTPRGEEPADTLIRARSIEAVRKGMDPNTTWAVKSTNISGVGGN